MTRRKGTLLGESYTGTNKLSTLLVERYQKYIVGRQVNWYNHFDRRSTIIHSEILPSDIKE